ncbi:hypothetical protein M3Y94_00577000 [Aphelenchoides besseyi]|nr:hypothetical protein M3Y94_00577000 [Aphelenchoides besseyi]KAI6221987.1 hypothetical protein M3Y95_00937000 [Aphelenchoides besseyi]
MLSRRRNPAPSISPFPEMDADSHSTSGAAQLRPYDVHFMLAKAIHNRKDVIINPCSSIPREKISHEKERAWEAVRLEMVANGVQRFATRTWRTVRDVDWQHLRRRVVNKIAENIKLYQTPEKDLNELDMIVLDTLGKTSDDGSFDFSDLIKTDPVEEPPKSVGSERSENGIELDNPILSSNAFLADVVGYVNNINSNHGQKRPASSAVRAESAEKRPCSATGHQRNGMTSTQQQDDENDQSNDDRQLQWENIFRELGLGRQNRDDETHRESTQLEQIRVEQERFRLEAEKYRAEQERYKSLQERWKAETEKVRLEEAKLRLSRLRQE